MDAAGVDPQSGCRIPLVRREDLDAGGQKLFDHYTSSASAVDGRPGGRPSRKHPLPVPAGGAPVVLSARDRAGESAGKMPR